MFCNNRTVGLYFPLSVIYYYNNNIITIASTLFYHTFPKLFWSSPEPLSLNNSASPEITQPFLLQTPSFSSLPLSLPPSLPACLCLTQLFPWSDQRDSIPHWPSILSGSGSDGKIYWKKEGFKSSRDQAVIWGLAPGSHCGRGDKSHRPC